MFRWLKSKSIEEETKSEVKEFDKDAWEAFVRYVHSSKFKTERLNGTNKLFIEYKYLNVDYTCLLYRYNIRDGKILNIEFHVPDNPKSTLSCNLINRVNKVAYAIDFIDDLCNNRLGV